MIRYIHILYHKAVMDTHDTIIDTMRIESVIDLAENLVKETGIDEKFTDTILTFMYQYNAAGLQITPEQLLFDSESVHKTLNNIRAKIEAEKDLFQETSSSS